MAELILASRSPERLAILSEIFSDIRVVVADIDESSKAGEKIENLVLRLAEEKAKHIHQNLNNPAHVVAADTLIGYQDEQIGKPKNRSHAEEILSHLSNRNFEVWTGTCIITNKGELFSQCDRAVLKMCDWHQEKLNAYLDNGIWQNRAGAFSIHEKDCPAQIIEGDLDVVRGISRAFVQSRLTC